MSDIPPEIIREILCRLPVKSLLRFRCVTKTVKAIIESSTFIQDHLRRQQSHLKLLVNCESLFSTSLDSFQLEHPLKLPNGPAELVGTCHGLVLLFNSQKQFLLWNPSTRLLRKLPDCGFKPPENSKESLVRTFAGLGYDGSSEDYKVVTLTQWFFVDDRSSGSQLMIYNLKLDLWKKVEGCPHRFCHNGALVGGALHWIASTDLSRPRVILGINLQTEKFEQVPYPDNLANPRELKLSIFGECLCLISLHTTAENGILDHVNVWVMKEYGVKQSWVKLFSLGHEHIHRLAGKFFSFSYFWPVAYSRTRREVLLIRDNRKLLWYSLENNSIKRAKISVELRSLQAFSCLETLVPLYGGGVGNDRDNNIEPDDRGKRRAEKKRGDGFLSKGFNLKL